MTKHEFNTKYHNYVEGTYEGLMFDIPIVTKYLDRVFQNLIQLPNFKYNRIRIYLGNPRVYTNLGVNVNFVIEKGIKDLI